MDKILVVALAVVIIYFLPASAKNLSGDQHILIQSKQNFTYRRAGNFRQGKISENAAAQYCKKKRTPPKF